MTSVEPSATGSLRVWDPLVRIAHWTLAASVALAWFTRVGGGAWHERIGYVSLAIIAIRVLWGWCGSRYARFSHFVRGPRTTVAYARETFSGREPRYIGHNPLGGWMIVALMVGVTVTAGSGWLYTTDRFWGVSWVETLHRVSTNVLLTFVLGHVLGVLYASYHHRENLIGAMFHGRKRSESIDQS